VLMHTEKELTRSGAIASLPRRLVPSLSCSDYLRLFLSSISVIFRSARSSPLTENLPLLHSPWLAVSHGETGTVSLPLISSVKGLKIKGCPP